MDKRRGFREFREFRGFRVIEENFIQKQSERLLTYFKAKSRLGGMIDMPKLEDIKIIVKELCEIAEIEGNASDVFIQVFDTDEGLVVRPVVKIRRKKEDEDEC